MITFRSIGSIVICILGVGSSVSDAMAHEQDGIYVEPGEKYSLMTEQEPGAFYDGMLFCMTDSENYKHAAALTTPMYYEYDNGIMLGGYYMGSLTIPSEMYGLLGIPENFTVVGVRGLYKNGLTSLYLPETIEWIDNTIESCYYLETLHLNNSLRVLNGVRDCPVLTDCPLPLSLEEIGDGWMSGIGVSQVDLPESLRMIGERCFCNLPNLSEITLSESLESLGDGCFSECPNLERVTLSSRPILSEGSFDGCPAIREVSVYAQIPYEFPSHCMADTDKTECTLYVPEGCEELYTNAKGWCEFGRIIASLPTGITATEMEPNNWRVFTSRGYLVIDSAFNDEIGVYNISGQHVTTIHRKGRIELTLPQGMYIVASKERLVKVTI